MELEFSRENKIETMADLNRAFAEHLEITDIPLDESRSDILKRIQRVDEECFSILASFNNSWLAYEYVRSDKELKVKVEDVWKMEVERHREAFDDCTASMLELAKSRKVDLESFSLRLKWL
ncbi:MAG: hypothetical protein ABFS05_08920 [Bacteroidota bacterium]